jgi:hypothetical protein
MGGASRQDAHSTKLAVYLISIPGEPGYRLVEANNRFTAEQKSEQLS